MDRIADLRKDYTQAELSEGDLTPNPFAQFSHWFEQALRAELPEPNAMTLATVSADGRPAARIVLIKGFDERGFCFYTNYDSRKGHELSAKPLAALLFHWTELERQVRIEGRVERVEAELSDAYYASRPLSSRLGAWASPQSKVLTGRNELQQRLQAVTDAQGDNPARPPFWGGYRVVPDYFEFWQGRPSRLHDRLCYRLDGNGQWVIERLAPRKPYTEIAAEKKPGRLTGFFSLHRWLNATDHNRSITSNDIPLHPHNMPGFRQPEPGM